WRTCLRGRGRRRGARDRPGRCWCSGYGGLRSIGTHAFAMFAGFDGRGARLQAEPMRLADYGVPADPAELVGDLAGGHAAFPHFPELFDSLVCPGHSNSYAPLGLSACGGRRGLLIDRAMTDQPKMQLPTPGVPVIP